MGQGTHMLAGRIEAMHKDLLAAIAHIAKNTASLSSCSEVIEVADAGASAAHQQAPKAPPERGGGPKVEIMFNGFRRILVVDGREISRVLTLETPRGRGPLAGLVQVGFLASEIVEREVSEEQFDALLRQK